MISIGRNGKRLEKNKVIHLLESLGIPCDGVLLIHSSFRGLSRVGYKAEAVLRALVDYMEPGTLLMPTMSWRAVNPENPFFDELTTPSITGILTEMFRTMFATKRSLHPTHSVAGRGRITDSMLSTHHLDEMPCSLKSPWGLLGEFNAHILLLGVGMDSCTLMHHMEQVEAPHLYLQAPELRERYICRDRLGIEIEMYTRRTLRLPRDFWQFEEVLMSAGRIKIQEIAGTVCRSFLAQDLEKIVMDTLKQKPDAIIAKPGQRCKMM